jgi:hypothetical protein
VVQDFLDGHFVAMNSVNKIQRLQVLSCHVDFTKNMSPSHQI